MENGWTHLGATHGFSRVESRFALSWPWAFELIIIAEQPGFSPTRPGSGVPGAQKSRLIRRREKRGRARTREEKEKNLKRTKREAESSYVYVICHF